MRNRQANDELRQRQPIWHCSESDVTTQPPHTDLPFPDALRQVLSDRTTLPTASDAAEATPERATLNALATRIGVAQSHLWRIVNRPDERRATTELIASAARALELPEDYFLETRASRVDEYLRAHPDRLNAMYAEASDSGGLPSSPSE
jgi:transcriptional regulator with XRE-family HTH domain